MINRVDEPICYFKNGYKGIWTLDCVLYETVCALFRTVILSIQYPVVKLSVTFGHWRWIPSPFRGPIIKIPRVLFEYDWTPFAIPEKNRQVISRNIGNLSSLPTSLSSIWNPFSKSLYEGIGREQGLRITHDITFRPASGLCLGKSFAFLSNYLHSKESHAFTCAILAANAADDMKSIEVQAIYDALIGNHGTVQANEKEFFQNLLQGKENCFKKTSQQELFITINSFLNQKQSFKFLREFVLNDLERKGVEITVDLYALILELDTIWSLSNDKDEIKNHSVHLAIVQAIANFLKLEVQRSIPLSGSIISVRDQLKKFQPGAYLIQFFNHSVVFIKNQDHSALFDPNEGLGLFDEADLDQGLLQLLKFYGSGESISLRTYAQTI